MQKGAWGVLTSFLSGKGIPPLSATPSGRSATTKGSDQEWETQARAANRSQINFSTTSETLIDDDNYESEAGGKGGDGRPSGGDRFSVGGAGPREASYCDLTEGELVDEIARLQKALLASQTSSGISLSPIHD